MEEFPVDKWNQVIEINLNSVFHAMRLTLPSMKARGYGRIINISSVHGRLRSLSRISQKPSYLIDRWFVAFPKASLGPNTRRPMWLPSTASLALPRVHTAPYRSFSVHKRIVPVQSRPWSTPAPV